MFLIGAENLPSSLYTPLVALLVGVRAQLAQLAGRARGKEDTAGADRWETYASGC